MEALKGETLRERINRGPIKVTDVLDIGIQLADALEAAHSQLNSVGLRDKISPLVGIEYAF